MTARGRTLESLADDLEQGRMTASALVEAALSAADAPAGQGPLAFTLIDHEGARRDAAHIDRLRRRGAHPSRFAGIPLSVKDLFDVVGQVTRAGSVTLDDGPATQDAVVVARLRAAGFVLVGRTNMTEFAYSGLGLNPHYGTPLSPWRRDEAHIAGGSSSGAAVSVADGFADAALGTDTGGSCRIPAAFCGLVGFKPTADRAMNRGVAPLSTTLDTVGWLTRSVGCAVALHDIVYGVTRPVAETPGRVRLLAPRTVVLDGLDADVAQAYERALAELEADGADIHRLSVPELEAVAGLNARGGISTAEAFAWHRQRLQADGARYDPRVRTRIERGAELSAADYIDLLEGRAAFAAAMDARLAGFDAMIMPTAPIAPPRIADLALDSEYLRINALVLRNSTLVNMFDGCAISMPIHRGDEPPVGLTIAAGHGADRALLAVATRIERALGR
jgi:aspartyl-tRNA(Asn)/glutamyl-tRNA(Gln) amidotransferase subunit A